MKKGKIVRYLLFRQVEITGDSRFSNGYQVGSTGWVFQESKAKRDGRMVHVFYVSNQTHPKDFATGWFAYYRDRIRFTGVRVMVRASAYTKAKPSKIPKCVRQLRLILE